MTLNLRKLVDIPKVANNLRKTAELHQVFKAKLAVYLLCLHIKKMI